MCGSQLVLDEADLAMPEQPLSAACRVVRAGGLVRAVHEAAVALVLAADTCALRTVPHVPPSAGVMSVVVSPLEAVEQMEGRRRGEGVERRCEQRRRRLLVGQRGDAQRQPIEAEIPALQGKNLPEDPLLEENLPVVALTWKAPSVRSAWGDDSVAGCVVGARAILRQAYRQPALV
jgi:hypothetical protein